jgi:hypothetical protein
MDSILPELNSACDRCKVIYRVKPCKHIKLFNSKYGPDYEKCPCINCLVSVMCTKDILCDEHVEWLMGQKND